MKYFSGRSGLNPGRQGLHAGYLTFHRVDMKMVKSPSVGVPVRALGFVFVLALVGLMSYGSIEVYNSDEGFERALVLFHQGTEALSIQSAGLGTDR